MRCFTGVDTAPSHSSIYFRGCKKYGIWELKSLVKIEQGAITRYRHITLIDSLMTVTPDRVTGSNGPESSPQMALKGRTSVRRIASDDFLGHQQSRTIE